VAHLSIALLGPFQATLGGQPITTFRSDRVRALLAYLAVEAARPHARDTLAALLWPDWPQEYARSSLRSALANLRQAIGDAEPSSARSRASLGDADADPPFLLITRETIQFNRESDHSLDVRALLEAAAPGQSTPAALEAVRGASALYRGDFLEGFSIPDSAAYEEWAAQERESLRKQALGLLHHLAEVSLDHGDGLGAESYARRCLQLDPWD
jgi:DNA-binding SARP family transcriptional activator